MIVCEVKLKKWGNSVGFRLPKDALRKEGLRAEQTVKITVMPLNVPKVKDIMGKAKLKTPTDELMRQIDRDLDSKFFR